MLNEKNGINLRYKFSSKILTLLENLIEIYFSFLAEMKILTIGI